MWCLGGLGEVVITITHRMIFMHKMVSRPRPGQAVMKSPGLLMLRVKLKADLAKLDRDKLLKAASG